MWNRQMLKRNLSYCMIFLTAYPVLFFTACEKREEPQPEVHYVWTYKQVQIGDMSYNLDTLHKAAEVTKYDSERTKVEIPSTVEFRAKQYVVKCVGDRAFYNCTNLASVSIPYGVTSIGEEAFAGCTNLDHISIPKSVNHIGRVAFLQVLHFPLVLPLLNMACLIHQA